MYDGNVHVVRDEHGESEERIPLDGLIRDKLYCSGCWKVERECCLHSTRSGHNLVVHSCEHISEPLNSIQIEGCFDLMSDDHLLRMRFLY